MDTGGPACVQDHILVESQATVPFTKKQYESYSLPRRVMLRIVRDPFLFFAIVPSYVFLITGVHNLKFPWWAPTVAAVP